MANKKIKFKVNVTLATENPNVKDIDIEITFQNPQDFNFAKQRMTRHIILNMLRSLRSQSNGLFIRTLGYYDYQTKIIIKVNSQDTSSQFLKQIQQMTKMLLTQTIDKPRDTEVINVKGNGRQMKATFQQRKIREAKVPAKDYQQWENKYPNNYGKFKYYYSLDELFDDNIKQFAKMIKEVSKTNYNVIGRWTKTGLLSDQYIVYEVWNKKLNKIEPVLFFIQKQNKFYSNYNLDKIISIFEQGQDNPEQMENIVQSISEYPRAKALFDSLIKSLRLKFRKFNDEELQAFMTELAKWTEGYR